MANSRMMESKSMTGASGGSESHAQPFLSPRASLGGRPYQGPEHRSEERRAIGGRSACIIRGRPGQQTLYVRNRSRGGIQFDLEVPVTLQEQLTVVLCLCGKPPVQLEVQVRWIRPVTLGAFTGYRVGAAILSSTEAAGIDTSA